MAVTLKARRTSGDMFTNTDNLEVVFDYLTDVGKLQECYTTILQVSGVAATHGGGAIAEAYLHYKAYDLHADEDGYIDYSSQSVQVQQAEKGVSVIKVKVQYLTKADYDSWETSYAAWETTYVTKNSLENGEIEHTIAEGAPSAPTYAHSYLTTGEITLNWSDDSFV